ncbi:MAG: hypothetical protein Q4G59_10050 [Planctomycetia bacterium]|nr:hypothetical protein [Planctomycetia bacterium]
MLVTIILVSLVAICFNEAQAASGPALTEACEKLEARSKQFIDIQFEYTVATNLIDSTVQGTQHEDEMFIRNRTETLSFLHANNNNNSTKFSLPWVSWIAQQESHKITPIASFFVYDGKKYYRFLRGNHRSAAATPTHSGLVDAGYNNLFLTENYFERILFLKMNGSSLNLDAIKRSTSWKEYRYVKNTEIFGSKAFVYERVRVPGKLVNISTVITQPCFMVVSYKTVSIPDNTILAELKVDELASFNGLIYPIRGSYTEKESKRSYTFHVTKVERLTENARINWIPAWPEGTNVRDVANHKSVEHFIDEYKQHTVHQLP